MYEISEERLCIRIEIWLAYYCGKPCTYHITRMNVNSKSITKLSNGGHLLQTLLICLSCHFKPPNRERFVQECVSSVRVRFAGRLLLDIMLFEFSENE